MPRRTILLLDFKEEHYCSISFARNYWKFANLVQPHVIKSVASTVRSKMVKVKQSPCLVVSFEISNRHSSVYKSIRIFMSGFNKNLSKRKVRLIAEDSSPPNPPSWNNSFFSSLVLFFQLTLQSPESLSRFLAQNIKTKKRNNNMCRRWKLYPCVYSMSIIPFDSILP